MSHLRTVQDGDKLMLQWITNQFTPGAINIHLFQNNITPAVTDHLAAYTEATFSGYTSVSATGWGAPTIDGTGHGVTQATPVVFTAFGLIVPPQSIYGYYATDSTNGTLLWAERFDTAPVVIALGGSTITITPSLSLITEF